MKSTMEKKIADFKRFISTLLILSSYLYIGTLISIYEYHTNLSIYLYPIIMISLITAFIMCQKIKQWQQQLAEE